MEKANNTLYSLGSATHAAKRAADVVFVLQNQDRLDYATLVERLNETLQTYGENSKVTYADLDELKIVSRKLYAIFAAHDVATVAALLNAILAEYAHAPRLSAHGKTAWHLHVDSDDDAP